MKRKIELNYLIPLEFVSKYLGEGFEKERKLLEEKTKLPIFDIIRQISVEGLEGKLYSILKDFALDVGYCYCDEHDIFYEYNYCPFCALGIDY